MELKLTKNPLKIELNLSQFTAKAEVECVELYSLGKWSRSAPVSGVADDGKRVRAWTVAALIV